jgi:hypothetical protein
MSMDEISTLWLAGKVGPHRESHEPRLDARLFLPDELQPVSGYLEWDGIGTVGEDWGMDGNDVWGDCGPASVDHYDIAKAQNPALVGSLGRPKYDGTLGTYWAIGLANGEVGTPPNPPDEPDEGVNNANMLGLLYKWGIIYGYGEVPLDQLDWFASQARGAVIGLNVNSNQVINDFNAQPKIPWGTQNDVNAGHDVLLIKTTTSGGGRVITWGAQQPFSVEFRPFITDAWIIYDKDDPNVDHTKLLAALADVHGTVTSPSSDAPAPAAGPSPKALANRALATAKMAQTTLEASIKYLEELAASL